MSDDFIGWPEEAFDDEDTDEIDVKYYVIPKKAKNARARRKLEMYWERKRLADNLYDVLSDEQRTSSELSHDELVHSSTMIARKAVTAAHSNFPLP